MVKCITCDEHVKWLAVGSNNDIIATLHPHTGEVLASWKTAEFSVSCFLFHKILSSRVYRLEYGSHTLTHMKVIIFCR